MLTCSVRLLNTDVLIICLNNIITIYFKNCLKYFSIYKQFFKYVYNERKNYKGIKFLIKINI